MPVVHLRRGGTSRSSSTSATDACRAILHWGADLGRARSAGPSLDAGGCGAADDRRQCGDLPPAGTGRAAAGRGAGSGGRASRAAAQAGRSRRCSATRPRRPSTSDAAARCATATDPESALQIAIELELTADGDWCGWPPNSATPATDGYRRRRAGAGAARCRRRAAELLDLTGRWARERVPQRHPFPVGAWVRESRGGKPGLDHTVVLAAGEAGLRVPAREGLGRAPGVERQPGARGRAGARGYELAAGGRAASARRSWCSARAGRTAPRRLYGSWGDGLDDLAARFHRYLRARPGSIHARRGRCSSTPGRPCTSGTTRRELIELAAAERRARAPNGSSSTTGGSSGAATTHPRSATGWSTRRSGRTASTSLAARVHELGMQFGLWFEPGDDQPRLRARARASRAGSFDGGPRPGLPSRHQHVLDLGHEDAYELVLERISAVVGALGIDFIKWDHNRYLTDAGHSATGARGRAAADPAGLPDDGRAAASGIPASRSSRARAAEAASTSACSSAPTACGRADCNDPHDRIDIQRWTGLLLPPELQGTHIGAEESHTTHRVAPLDFRAATAFWGNLGVELDLTAARGRRVRAVRGLGRGARRAPRRSCTRARWCTPTRMRRGAARGRRRGRPARGPVPVRGARPVGGLAARPPAVPGARPGCRLRAHGVRPRHAGCPTDSDRRGCPTRSDRRRCRALHLSGRVLEEVGVEAPSLDVDRSVLLRLVAVG